MIKTNIKMMVTPEQSKQVQEICFANGMNWAGNIRKIVLTNMKYLVICTDIRWCFEHVYYDTTIEEVSAELFIRTSGTCVEEAPKQELKQNTNKEETMEKNEVESYADVKEYLIAKGLYERVLGIDWETYEEYAFRDLFTWSKTEEGHTFWDELNDEMLDLDIYDKVESLVQDYKAKQGKEFIKHLEAQPEEAIETKPKPTSYINVKEYLIAKGLYERVLNQKWRPLENGKTCSFLFLFTWINTIEGITYWNTIDEELRALGIHTKVESLIKDYKEKEGKEFIEETPEEAIETKPLEKPKQYLCYVQGKALPKHIHKTLEQAKQEAQRLCRKELAKVSVLEVVAEFEVEVVVSEIL